MGKKCCKLQHNAKKRCRILHSLFFTIRFNKKEGETQRKRGFLFVVVLTLVALYPHYALKIAPTYLR